MKDNKLIAEFMGYIDNGCSEDGFLKHPETNWDIEIDSFKYHTDWNWLMEVVAKIESLGVVVEIRENVCYIETSQGNYTSELEETKIQATYKAVVEFINWYYKQTLFTM